MSLDDWSRRKDVDCPREGSEYSGATLADIAIIIGCVILLYLIFGT